MKLNKQIVSVTLASTMILSSTSINFATSTDVNDIDKEEVSIEEAVEEASEDDQQLEALNKAILALEKAEKSKLQSDINITKELTNLLLESKDKENILNRLKAIEKNINNQEEINKTSSKEDIQNSLEEEKLKARAIEQDNSQENTNTEINLTNKLSSTSKDPDKVEEDKEISNELTEKINSLPLSSDLTIRDKKIVNETINKYNNLTENQKKFIKSKDVNKLLFAEDKVNKLEERANTEDAKEVDKLIDRLNIPTKTEGIKGIRGNYIKKVQKVEKAYDDLNESAKSLISKDNIDKLIIVKDKINKKHNMIDLVNDKIKALSNDEDISKNGELILQAKKSYDSLSKTSKSSIDKELRLELDRSIKNFKLFTKDFFPYLNQTISQENDISKKNDLLKKAQRNLEISKQLDMSQDRLNYYQKTVDKASRHIENAQKLSNKRAAKNIDTLISEFSKLDPVSKEVISKSKTVRESYNSLNDDAKTFVLHSSLEKLSTIEDEISKAEQSVKSIEDKISRLSDTKDVLRHGESILETKKIYDSLSDNTKDLVNEQVKLLLNETMKNFKSFTYNDLSNLSQLVSQESDFFKKQEIIDLAEKNLNLIKTLGLDKIELSHYQNLINQAKHQIQADKIDRLIKSFDESTSLDDLTDEYTSNVYRVKRIYDSLSPRAKELVPKVSREKLDKIKTNIELSKEKTINNLNELINSIPETNVISKDLVSKIEGARESYEALSDVDKNLILKSNREKLHKLEKTEVKIEELKSLLKPVEDKISLLPKNRNMLGYGKAILKAKQAYSSLPSEAKNLMSETSTEILNGSLMDFKSFTDRNISNLKETISKEVNIDKKQELIDLSQKSLNFVKDLNIGNEKIAQHQKIIDEAQNKVDVINKEIESKKLPIKLDQLIGNFDEVTNLEDITKDYVSKFQSLRKVHNQLDSKARQLVSGSNLKKLQRIETKIANTKTIVKSVESKIETLPRLATDKEILDNYETILNTKISYDNLSETAKSFVDEELESSLIEIVENFKFLIKNDIENLEGLVLSNKALRYKRNLVDKMPHRLEKARSLGMDDSEYNKYRSIIDENENLVSNLEEESIKLKTTITKAENALANLQENLTKVTLEDEEKIKATRNIVNEALALDENVEIKGIEILESLEDEYRKLKKQSILKVIDSLDEKTTEEQVKSTLQLLSDFTSDFDESTIVDKNLSRYLDSFKELTVESASNVQDLVVDVNDIVTKLEAAIIKAEDAIDALPSIEDVNIEDKMQVVNAKALIESVKVFDENATVKDQDKTARLDVKIAELEEAKKVEDRISNLVTLDKFTLENKPVAEEVLDEYKKLTVYQQSLVENIDDLFLVKSDLEEESSKSEQAITAIEKAKESKSEKDIAMAKALIETLSQDEDRQALASKLSLVEEELNKTEDEKIVAKIKEDLEFDTQISDTIIKPEDHDGVSFKLDVSNIRGAGLIRDARVNSNGDIDITRELSTRSSFDMIVTIQKGQVVDTKTFNVLVDAKLWPGNNMTTIKVKD